MTTRDERRAERERIERLMQEGEVVIDPPEVTCAKLGHQWEVTCHDAPDTPGEVRECHRCSAVELSMPGHDWTRMRGT
jgi:hypothetical protein